jgi:ATP-binding cassette subfamily B protein
MAKKINRMKTLIELSGTMKNYRLKTVFNILSGIALEAFTIFSAGISAYMAALALQGDLNEDSRHLLWILAGSIIGFAVFRYLEGLFSHDVAFHILVDFRVKMYKAFEKICPDVLLNSKSGQLSVTLMNDVEILEWFFGHTAGSIAATFVIVIGILGFLAWLHPLLLLVMLLSIGIIFVIPFLFKNTADTQGILNRYKLGDANSVTLEGLNGIREILALNYKKRYIQKNNAFMEELSKVQVDYTRRQGKEGGLLIATAGIASVAINITAILLVLKGKISLEWYTVVGTTIWLAFNPILSLCDKARSFGIIFASATRVFEILHSDPIIDDKGRDISIQEIKPSIDFEHVYFRYKTSTKDTISDVSFHIAPGEMVAFVGHSGAGKTTCTNLLMRLWDVSGGCIKIGGYDIRSLSLNTIHSLTSAVLQDVYMFNESIMENIRLGNPNATDDEVITAAKQAQAHEFILDFEDGYDTIAGERGMQLSGGQRQRIAIARSLLSNAPILIFDEAVSNLDTKSEQEIQYTLRTLAKTRTIVMVAHRLSTITMADRLVVFDNGTVVQIGTHHDLLEKEGSYKILISSQMQAKESIK